MMRSSILFAVILLLYGLAAFFYAWLTPAWQAPDEPAHYNYIRYLATEAAFPELTSGCYDQVYLNRLTGQQFPPELSIAPLCYEFHQPPLYYLLARPIFLASGGSLLALRLFSVLLGLGVVGLAYRLTRLLFPARPALSLGTMAFVAFVPMHTAILASINNDALAELILAAILLLLTGRLLHPGRSTPKKDILLGILLGLGLITKVTVYIALPLVAVALWLSTTDLRRLIKQAALIYGLAGLIGLPWYLRNAALYGRFDILGLARHNAVVIGQLRTAELIERIGWLPYTAQFLTTTFHSFWGQFGWMAVPMDGRTYRLLALLCLMAALGLGLNRIARSGRKRQAIALHALTILLTLAAYGWYNLTFVQFQGRYLFPALIPLGLFFSAGLWNFLNRRWWLIGALAAALVWHTLLADKRGMLLVGAALGITIAAHYRSIPIWWLMGLCYSGLALLTLLAPVWFVLPYLS